MATGAGTPGDPYLLSTAADLLLLQTYPSASFRLTADITLSSWTPVMGFSGALDGAGHTVTLTGVSVVGTTHSGFIGTLQANGSIKQLGIIGGTFSSSGGGTYYKAPLVAFCENGSITDCYAVGGTVVTASNRAGGFIGHILNTAITRCYSATVRSGAESSFTGGLTGQADAGNVTTSSYFDSSAAFWNSVSTGTNNAASTPKTTAELQQAATFVGWSMPGIWLIAEGVSSPTLVQQLGFAAEVDSAAFPLTETLGIAQERDRAKSLPPTPFSPCYGGHFPLEGEYANFMWGGGAAPTCEYGEGPYGVGCECDDEDPESGEYVLLQGTASGKTSVTGALSILVGLEGDADGNTDLTGDLSLTSRPRVSVAETKAAVLLDALPARSSHEHVKTAAAGVAALQGSHLQVKTAFIIQAAALLSHSHVKAATNPGGFPVLSSAEHAKVGVTEYGPRAFQVHAKIAPRVVAEVLSSHEHVKTAHDPNGLPARVSVSVLKTAIASPGPLLVTQTHLKTASTGAAALVLSHIHIKVFGEFTGGLLASQEHVKTGTAGAQPLKAGQLHLKAVAIYPPSRVAYQTHVKVGEDQSYPVLAFQIHVKVGESESFPLSASFVSLLVAHSAPGPWQATHAHVKTVVDAPGPRLLSHIHVKAAETGTQPLTVSAAHLKSAKFDDPDSQLSSAHVKVFADVLPWRANTQIHGKAAMKSSTFPHKSSQQHVKTAINYARFRAGWGILL